MGIIIKMKGALALLLLLTVGTYAMQSTTQKKLMTLKDKFEGKSFDGEFDEEFDGEFDFDDLKEFDGEFDFDGFKGEFDGEFDGEEKSGKKGKKGGKFIQ